MTSRSQAAYSTCTLQISTRTGERGCLPIPSYLNNYLEGVLHDNHVLLACRVLHLLLPQGAKCIQHGVHFGGHTNIAGEHAEPIQLVHSRILYGQLFDSNEPNNLSASSQPEVGSMYCAQKAKYT